MQKTVCLYIKSVARKVVLRFGYSKKKATLDFLRFLLASLYAGGKVRFKRANKSNGQSIDESRLGSNKTVSLTES